MAQSLGAAKPDFTYTEISTLKNLIVQENGHFTLESNSKGRSIKIEIPVLNKNEKKVDDLL